MFQIGDLFFEQFNLAILSRDLALEPENLFQQLSGALVENSDLAVQRLPARLKNIVLAGDDVAHVGIGVTRRQLIGKRDPRACIALC